MGFKIINKLKNMKGVEGMGKNIDKDRQNKTVLFDALKNHLSNRVVRFDVPGHKGGREIRNFGILLGWKRCRWMLIR